MKVYQEYDGRWHVHRGEDDEGTYLFCLAVFSRNDWRGAINAAIESVRKRAKS